MISLSKKLNSKMFDRSDARVRRRSSVCCVSGFSLLELMIAMFILIILLSVALPTYQRSVQHAKETVLKENLWQMRKAIDQRIQVELCCANADDFDFSHQKVTTQALVL